MCVYMKLIERSHSAACRTGTTAQITKVSPFQCLFKTLSLTLFKILFKVVKIKNAHLIK